MRCDCDAIAVNRSRTLPPSPDGTDSICARLYLTNYGPSCPEGQLLSERRTGGRVGPTLMLPQMAEEKEKVHNTLLTHYVRLISFGRNVIFVRSARIISLDSFWANWLAAWWCGWDWVARPGRRVTRGTTSSLERQHNRENIQTIVWTNTHIT